MGSTGLSFAAFVLPILVLLWLGGLILAIRGWRGRRVGDHPTCRACGFDLFNAPQEQARCPECGADLTRPRAIAIGHRRRNRKSAIAGGVALAVSLLLLVVIGRGMSSRIPWDRARPTWYALREARGSLPGSQAGAIDVLVYRADNGGLSDATRARLVALLIQMQPDATQPWNGAWGGFLAGEAVTGRLDAAQRDSFFRNLLGTPVLRVRKTVRSGDSIPTELRLSSGGRGMGTSGGLYFHRPNLAVRLLSDDCYGFIDEQPAADPSGQRGGSIEGTLSGWSGTMRERVRARSPLAVGTHEIEIRTIAHVRNGMRGDDLYTLPLTAKATVAVVDANDATVITRHADESLRPTLMSAIRPSIRLSSDGRPESLQIAFDRGRIPTSLGFDVVLQQADHKQTVSGFAVPKGSGQSGGMNATWNSGLNLNGFDDGPIDLHLVPSESAAASTMDVFDIWDGELVFPDLPRSK